MAQFFFILLLAVAAGVTSAYHPQVQAPSTPVPARTHHFVIHVSDGTLTLPFILLGVRPTMHLSPSLPPFSSAGICIQNDTDGAMNNDVGHYALPWDESESADANIDYLKIVCLNNPECYGFNAHGYLKKQGATRSYKGSTFYEKVPGVRIALRCVALRCVVCCRWQNSKHAPKAQQTG